MYRISCSSSFMNSWLNISGSSMGVVALSHSIRFLLSRKFMPSSSSRSLPTIMSYLDDNLSVSSTKSFPADVSLLMEGRQCKFDFTSLGSLETSSLGRPIGGLLLFGLQSLDQAVMNQCSTTSCVKEYFDSLLMFHLQASLLGL